MPTKASFFPRSATSRSGFTPSSRGGFTPTRRGGFTLLEVSVAAAVLLVIFGLTSELLVRAASSWSKTDAQADLTQEVAVALSALSRATQLSTPAGITAEPGRLALLSPLDPAHNGNTMALDAGGHLLWRSYRLFFWNDNTRELRLRELAVAPDSAPLSLEQADLGSGPQPLTFYAQNPAGRSRRLASWITRFEVARSGPRLTFSLRAARNRQGSSAPEVVDMTQAAVTRN